MIKICISVSVCVDCWVAFLSSIYMTNFIDQAVSFYATVYLHNRELLRSADHYYIIANYNVYVQINQ
jgi:hypothetical protein